MIAGEKILPGETLVIFDEIQECPAALNALKYFKEKANEYHVISAGSLLGTLLAQPKSYPVGMVNLLDLTPLTFDEFLGAEIIPIEAKGSEDKSAPSFKRYIADHQPEYALRFSKRGYRKDGYITNLPLYLARKTRELL